jgi:DNA-binding NarL/FixJ family response regulator
MREWTDEVTVPGLATELAPTAVVAERVPLVRVGLAASLAGVGVTAVALVDELEAGVEAVRDNAATLLVVGDATAEAIADQIGGLGSTRIIVLVPRADRRALAAMFEAGADGVALRTILPEEFGVLVRRVLAGERSIDPALMSVLLELARDSAVPTGPDPSRPGAVEAVTVSVPTAKGEEGLRRSGDGVPLTTKERQVLTRLAQGDSNAEIATALFVSPATIKTHLAHIYAKLGVASRHGATSRATSLGLLP